MSAPQDDAASAPPRAARLSRPLSLLGLSFACLLLAVIAGAVYGGYRAGLAEHDRQRRATQTIELKVQYDIGITDLAAGRYALAAERFRFVLSIDPAYPGAADRLAEAQAALHVTPSPQPPASPTPGSKDQSPAEVLAYAEQASAAGDWDGVIRYVTQLRALDPSYAPVKLNSLLFTALRQRGVARIQGDQMEAGIADLDRARAIGALDAEATSYRAWARLYLDAQSYWGLDWMQAAQILQQLYVLAPNFKDTTPKALEATLNYARQLEAAGDFCRAAEQYATAQSISPTAAVGDPQSTAQAACALLLTPTPDSTPFP